MRISPSRARDEIGRLGSAINDMSARLKRAHDELESKNKTLDETLRSLKDSMRRVKFLEQLKGELAKFAPTSVKKLLEQNPDATELENVKKTSRFCFLILPDIPACLSRWMPDTSTD